MVSVNRLNPFYEWTVPLFVGTIAGVERDATVTGTIRPSFAGMTAAVMVAAATVISLILGYWPLVGSCALLIVLFCSAIYVYRGPSERARSALRAYLNGL